MTRAVARTGLCLAAALSSLLASGCYVPGGGWTMRTGLDTRRRHKPSVFVELVDSRWDEFNRVATMNLDSPVMEVNGVVLPSGQPNGQSGFTLPAANGPMVPAVPAVPSNGEPHQMPGSPAETLPPSPPLPTNDAPTALRGLEGAPNSSSGDDASLRAAGDDDGLDDGDDDGEDLARRNSNWFQRVSGRLSGKCRKAPAGDLRNTATDGEKTAVRPAASRLFSRPR
jgi:hypothetical protein